MKKNFFLALSVGLIFFSGCKKDKTENPSTPSASSNSYFPVTMNSNWSYEFDDDPTDTFQIKITGTLSAIGNTYSVMMPTQPRWDTSYYRKSGGDYLQWFDYGEWLGQDDPASIEYTMLKDNVPVGTNWKSADLQGTYQGVPENYRLSHTILQKDVAVTITSSTGTVTYPNVIVVDQNVEEETSPGVWQPLLNRHKHFYYARGVGMIKYESVLSSGNISYAANLRRYQVF